MTYDGFPIYFFLSFKDFLKIDFLFSEKKKKKTGVRFWRDQLQLSQISFFEMKQ